MNRGKCRLAGNRLIVDDNDAGCSARKLMLSRGWPSLAAEAFSLNDKAVDAPALIVGERPFVGSAVGAGCFCGSSIKIRDPCAVSVPPRLQEGRRRRTRTCA
jgi:hypothetical protein